MKSHHNYISKIRLNSNDDKEQEGGDDDGGKGTEGS